MVAACMEMRGREAAGQMLESADLADSPSSWKRKHELARIKRLYPSIKQPPPPTPAKPSESQPSAAPEWEALPSGTRLRVWWEGSGEYYECTILNWRVAVGDDGALFYTHRCLYDSGIFDHDLAKAEFEVLDVAHAWMHADDEDEEGMGASDIIELGALADGGAPSYGTNVDGIEELSPRRKWLAMQEARLLAFQEELENADIATPIGKPLALAAGEKKPALRGRVALRRLRMPNGEREKAFVTPRLTSFRPGAADTFRIPETVRIIFPLPPRVDSLLSSPVDRELSLLQVRIVDPSDAKISYRVMTSELASIDSGS